MLFWFILSVLLNVVMLVGAGFALFYIIKFARIIMSIEDSLENTLDVFETTSAALDNLLNMQLFFESKEVQVAVREALSEVKLSKVAVSAVIKEFTRLSKQRYEIVRVNENDENEDATDGN